MKNNAFPFLIVLILLLTGCKDRTVDKLRPETVAFLESKEQARCACLEEYGKGFIPKMEEEIKLMKTLPDSYDLNNLSPKDVTIIRAGLSSFEGLMRMLQPCMQQRAQQQKQPDQLTQMLIGYDMQVVLELDSTKTKQEQMKEMDKLTIEVMEDLCPDQVPIMLKVQEFLEVAQILPPELQ